MMKKKQMEGVEYFIQRKHKKTRNWLWNAIAVLPNWKQEKNSIHIFLDKFVKQS